MMRSELGLEKPDPRRALTSALTIAGAFGYVKGTFTGASPLRGALQTALIGRLAAAAAFVIARAIS